LAVSAPSEKAVALFFLSYLEEIDDVVEVNRCESYIGIREDAMMWPLRLMGRRIQGVVECGALVVTGRSGLAGPEPALSVQL
jgi:hypothetical protein